ncbi:hypothetical protein ACQ4PT_016202 [Festuca glaucescens]
MQICYEDESSIVLKEILSLRRERRELLSSLTPGVSVWKRLGQPETLLAANTTAPVQEIEMESASTDEQLDWYVYSILQDMDDLVHRMLSMAYVMFKSDGATFSSYMADELVKSTSRLHDACQKFCIDTMRVPDKPDERVHEFALLGFCDEFLLFPYNFENKLTLVITKKMEEDYRHEVDREMKRVWEDRKRAIAEFKRWEKRMKKYEEEEEKKKKKKKKGRGEEKGNKYKKFLFNDGGPEEHDYQDEDEDQDQDQEQEQDQEKLDLDRNTGENLVERMKVERKFFMDDRDGWNSTWGSKSGRCGDFKDKTTLSSMHFTHTIQPSCGVIGSTLEIYDIKILELKGELKWPLKLYGMVAARDTVDRNRNVIFSRSSLDHQELDKNGSLCLTGPSRAIVALDYVDFEVELKIKEGEKSQGEELITLSKRYDCTGTSLMFENNLCKAVLKLHRLFGAVQATIVGVCVVGGVRPIQYGCRVACSWEAAADQAGGSLYVTPADEVVLLDCCGGPGGGSKNKEVSTGSDCYLHLSRNVVSVPSGGGLRVRIYSYTRSGTVDREWNIVFPAQKCQTIEKELSVRTTKIKVVVAWSLLVQEKLDLWVDCPAAEA